MHIPGYIYKHMRIYILACMHVLHGMQHGVKQGSTDPRAPCVGAHLEMYVTEEMMENPRFTRAWKTQSLKTGARNPMSAALFGENGRFAVAWRPILQAALKLPAWYCLQANSKQRSMSAGLTLPRILFFKLPPT